jgi:cobalt-zinc-cadmium efflux system outer membrane protein
VKNLGSVKLDGSRDAASKREVAKASESKQSSGIQRISYQAERSPTDPTRQQADSPRRTLEIPKDIPGSEAAPLRLPPFDPNEPDEKRREHIERLFEKLPNVPERLQLAHPPEGRPLSLADFQQIAFDFNPALRRAGADVEIARGVVVQSGLYPNPQVGYEADTVRTLATRGYQGPFVQQTIITGGKLTLAQNAAMMEFHNAELALLTARIDVATQVRVAFYDMLVAREKVRLTRALAKFTDDIYRAQIKLASGGQAAPFEPLQLRVLAMQARNAVTQAETEQESSWRRLSAAAGQPRMVAVPLAGDVDETLPALNFDSAREHLLANHTQIRAAANDVIQARYQTDLECIKPRVPDVTVYTTIQKDYTGAPYNTTYNLQVSIPLPVFDRNQGNILRASAGIIRGENDRESAGNDLIQQLADAVARYESSRLQADNYRTSLLPDQVRTYRGIYQRYQEDREAVNFGDIVVAQQTLAFLITSYIDVLSQQWRAFVEVNRLLQMEDVGQIGQFAESPADGSVPPSPAPPSVP